jgi:hypothetical protein
MNIEVSNGVEAATAAKTPENTEKGTNEVLVGQVSLPVVGNALVELLVLLLLDVLGLASPERLGLVEELPLLLDLLDLLLLLILLLLSLLIDLFNLGLVLLLVNVHLLGVGNLVVIVHLLLLLLDLEEIDGVLDELRVLLDEVLQAALLEVLEAVLLHVKDNLGAAAERLARGITANGEVSAGLRLPNVLLVIVVLRDNGDTIGSEVGGVETDTELADEGDVGGVVLEALHELLGARGSDGTEAVNEIGLGPTGEKRIDGEKH